MQPRLAKVPVDQEDAPADLRQRQRQVARHRRLAFPRVGAGQRDHARPVAVLSGIQNGGQRRAEGIGKHRRPPFPGGQLHRALPILFFRLLRLRAPDLAIVCEALAAFRMGRGDHAQFGHVKIQRRLARALDAPVRALPQDDEDESEKAAGEQAEHGVQHQARLIRPQWAAGPHPPPAHCWRAARRRSRPP